ncbi:hypothetical protein SAMD00020551_0465 [Mesobacillus selenatarsenatis SF-1]|uniref:DUF3149 domain-containing protein n=2 Tax=Mesobacillus selenatarsenatis TaxID=388741 RepID=A0A0A8WXH8_MESS1|nr:hypothetical protein SAMD00020551_0465 [Mesobacillus selenatarsenatis SF-1]
MWLYNLNPFNMDETLVMILFISGGSLLLLAFILFVFVTFFIEKTETRIVSSQTVAK